MNNYLRLKGQTLALLSATLLLAGTTQMRAQVVLDLSNIGGFGTSGAHADVFATGQSYQVDGTVANNFTPTTFGQSYHIANTVAGASTISLNLAGSITGTPSPIAAGTQVTISYAFLLEKGAAVSGPVTWGLRFDDNVNLAGVLIGDSPQAIGLGGIYAASGAGTAPFSSSGTYTFTSSTALPNTFGANLVLDYVADSTAAFLNVTMLNTGYGGQGITISAVAVPEPSLYAAFAGLGLVGFAAWRRRRTA